MILHSRGRLLFFCWVVQRWNEFGPCRFSMFACSAVRLFTSERGWPLPKFYKEFRFPGQVSGALNPTLGCYFKFANLFPAQFLKLSGPGLRWALPRPGRAARPALRKGTCPLDPFLLPRFWRGLSFLKKCTAGIRAATKAAAIRWRPCRLSRSRSRGRLRRRRSAA